MNLGAFFLALFQAVFLFCSCVSTGSFAAVDVELEKGFYPGGLELLEQRKNRLYTGRDTVLYCLDKGMLSHYAGRYTDSSQLLEEGERAIEEAFSKSVTREIASYLINDNTLEYGGEDYEDIYINAFNALNYYHKGNSEGAMVEIRRMNNKLRYLSGKYDNAILNIQKQAIAEGQTELIPNPHSPSRFTDSALARYLGMLFYRSEGQYDDARIDRDWLLTAFANTPAVYKYPVPSSVSDELKIPEGMARLNVLAFAGLSPVKKEAVIRIPLPNGRWIKIALPEMTSRGSEISRITLIIDEGNSIELELLEDIDTAAKEVFKERQAFVYAKSILRAVVKGAGSSALNAAARETKGNDSALLEVFSIATQLFAEFTEQADIRVSRYFPGKAYVGGINLPPGSYSFQIKYYNRQGREIAVIPYRDMAVGENTLNLAEAYCFK